MSMDVSRLFAHGAREVIPLLMRRQLSYTFAEQHCDWQVTTGERALRSSFHRLLLGTAGLLQQGFVAYHAAARPHRLGGCSLKLQIGGTGPLHGGELLEQALRELALAHIEAEAAPDGDPDAAAPQRLRRAQGQCPVANASIEFSCLPAAGFMLSASYLLRDAERQPALAPLQAQGGDVPALGPALWLVHADAVNAGSVTLQAQAHGWAVSRMVSLEEAARRLRGMKPHQPRPALVLVFANDGAPPAALQTLRQMLPSQVHFVYAVEVGSIWLRDGIDGRLLAGCDLACHPISGAEWRHWHTAAQREAPRVGSASDSAAWVGTPGAGRHPAAVPEAAVASRSPGGADAAHPARRPAVLVVDDDEFCCELARASLDALGYEARIARDGQQAIDDCCEEAPALVLMDLDMPRIDGFEATRRLRALQRDGTLPPFRILAASSAPDRAWITDAIEAGADAFLPKPLRLEALRGELARWCIGLPPDDAAAAPSPFSTAAADRVPPCSPADHAAKA